MDRQADLMGDRFRERHVAGRPGLGLGAMEAEHADHPVEDDHRRRERGAAAELRQGVAASERGIVQLLRARDVGDAHRPPLADGEVRDGQALGHVADRREAVRPPLGAQREPLVGLAEADEAARGPEGTSGLGDGHAGDRVEVARRTDPPRDGRHQPLARESLVKRGRRPGAVERDRRLSGHGLHQPQLLGGERTPLARRCDNEHSDHPLVDSQRHERGAPGLRSLRQPAADER